MQPNLALYRRYRPETFAEVIGQDHVTEPLRNALANNRVNHAYLFSGPRGCGKTTSARILARALNCERAPISDPCGECQSCRDLATGGPGSIDVIEIDAASHGGVDDARDLCERAFFAPVNSRYKVYIIDEAHMVTTQGFNALLKLVEEPPEHLKFIFATTEPEKVIPTIRSRTHHYPFRLIPPRTLSDHLAEICAKEGVPIDAAALPLVVRAGAGSARDSLSVLDQLLGGAGADGITYDVATNLLGYTPDALLDGVIDSFAAGDGAGVFSVIDRVIETGQDPRRFTEDLLRRLRDLVIVSAVPDAPASGLIDAPEDQAQRLVDQAARFGKAELVRAADEVAAGLTEMRGATTPRLLLELICARVLLPGAELDGVGLSARMDRLERRLSVAGPMSEQAVSTSSTSSAPAAAPTPVVEPVETPAPAPTPVVEPVETPAPAPTPVVEPVETPEPVSTSSTSSAPAAAPTPVVEPVETPAPAPSGGGLGLADVRRLWPNLLDRVKTRRRFTWILLSQNSQVLALDGKVLTIGLKSSGARESFVSSGGDEILRQAALDEIGVDWKVEAIVDPSTDPGADTSARVSRPAVDSQPEPPAAAPAPMAETAPAPEPVEAPAAPVRPDFAPPQAETIQRARDEIGRGRGEAAVRHDPDAEVDRDDADADDGTGGAELLERELGATLIEEIPHD